MNHIRFGNGKILNKNPSNQNAHAFFLFEKYIQGGDILKLSHNIMKTKNKRYIHRFLLATTKIMYYLVLINLKIKIEMN